MGTRLYLRDLSPETTENEIYSLFTSVGPVRTILLPMDKAGDSRGHGVVEMETAELSRTAARRMNGHMLHDRAMHVTQTRPPDLRSSPF